MLNPRSKEFAKVKHSLWVIDGYLGYNLSIKRLLKVSETYQKINLVPQGYM